MVSGMSTLTLALTAASTMTPCSFTGVVVSPWPERSLAPWLDRSLAPWLDFSLAPWFDFSLTPPDLSAFADFSVTWRARPKSMTRTWLSRPTMTLSGLKSRWTSPFSCAAASPRPAAMNTFRISCQLRDAACSQ